jgi:hypothetical protein
MLLAKSLDGGQIGLFGLDHVFAFVSLLADKVDGMLKEAEDAVLVALAMVAEAFDNATGFRGRNAQRFPSANRTVFVLCEIVASRRCATFQLWFRGRGL